MHLSPQGPLGGCATQYGLPNSNQPQEDGISQSGKSRNNPINSPINRREIPAGVEETIWRAADGHEIRRIDWPQRTGTLRGSLLFFPGRGDNYEKYLESLEEWALGGWRVTAADWRGQAGSGRLAGDPVTGHIDDFETWLRDLGDFWKLWKSEREGPHVLAGHSMGGHLVLRGLAEKYVDPDAMVLSAPMLGFIGRLPTSVMHGGARLLTKLKGNKTPAWKWSEKPGEIPEGRERLLTHDDDRYADELFWRQERPQLVMGPGSWGWVERSYASTRALFEPGVLESVETPIYMIATTNDKLVAFEAIADAVRRLPNGELLQFGDEARHEILREVNAVRDRAMAGAAEFLDRMAPAKN